MYQYKKTTGDDIAVQFYQSTKNKASTFRYGTLPEYACRPLAADKAVNTVVNTVSTSTPLSSPAQEVRNESLPSSSSPSVRQRKKNNDINKCKKCSMLMEEGWTMNLILYGLTATKGVVNTGFI